MNATEYHYDDKIKPVPETQCTKILQLKNTMTVIETNRKLSRTHNIGERWRLDQHCEAVW